MKSKSPLVSFIILNWNGKKRLEVCLASIKKVTYPNYEIVLVNNGSTDDSEEFVKKKYPKIKLINLKKNIGYAGGKNLGVSKASGKYILAIDNDTSVTPNFIQPLVDELENDPKIGIVQPQIRSMIKEELLDSVVSYQTSTGFLYHYGYMKPHKNKKYKDKLFGYSIKGACFIMARQDYINLGGLDESFLSYVEETDLCHRMWLSGKKVEYLPESVIYHWGGGDTLTMTSSNDSLFRSFRNRYYSYIKNFSFIELVKILPIHFLMCEMFVLSTLVKGDLKKSFMVQKGTLIWLFKFDSLIKKRNKIQKKIRKVSDSEINKFIKKNPRLEYYKFLGGEISKYKD